MSQYELDVINESRDTVAFCLHQRDPGAGYGPMPVAWLVRTVPNGSRARLSWTTDLSFVWGEMRDVRPGAVFRSAGSLDASPDGRGSQATFDNQGDGHRLDLDYYSPAPPGRLAVRTGPGVRIAAAVGIGMSGLATTVAGARPNMVLTFSARQEYWLAAGQFEEGEVLDPEGVAGAVRVTFPAGVSKVKATLTADRRLEVRPV